jgi:ABC-type phosphate/phosphonate transport system ATPase subunit
MGEFETTRTDKTLENVFGKEQTSTSTLLSLLSNLTEEQKQNLIQQLQTTK